MVSSRSSSRWNSSPPQTSHTPALVGGPTDQMVSGIIERAMNSENNWGKASALGAILLTATLILYFIYNRLVGIDKIRLG